MLDASMRKGLTKIVYTQHRRALLPNLTTQLGFLLKLQQGTMKIGSYLNLAATRTYYHSWRKSYFVTQCQNVCDKALVAAPAQLQCHRELMAIMLYTSKAKIQSVETSLHVHVYGRHTIKSFKEFLRLPDHGYKDYTYTGMQDLWLI